MYPTENKVYVPSLTDEKRKVTLDEAKTGRIVALSEDGTKATVEVKIGTQIVYCGVTVDENQKVIDFIPRPKGTIKYVTVNKDTGQIDPPE